MRHRKDPPPRRRALRAAAVALGAGAVLALVPVAAAAAPVPAASPAGYALVHGTVRPATGLPRLSSSVQATLWGNDSTATTTVRGGGRVVIGATGDFCQGWPRIAVSADGRALGTTVIVNARYYGSYPVGPALESGAHTVTVRFVNDHRDATCDRNVNLASVRTETAEVPAPAPAVPVAPASPAASPAPAPAASATPSPTAAAPATSTAAPTSAPPATSAPTSASASPSPSPSPTPVVTAPLPEQPDDPAQDRPVPQPATRPAPAPAVAEPAPAPAVGRPDPGRKPGAGNTGVPAGTALTRHDGDLTITEPGTVIDGLDVHGSLLVRASDVTVRRTLVRGRDAGDRSRPLVEAYGTRTNLRISDSTLRADTASPWVDGIKGHDFTLDRVDISNVVDNAQVIGGNVTIRDSWLHDTARFSPWPLQPDDQTHNDNVQIEGGDNVLIQHSVLETSSNTAIMITQNFARSRGIRVIDNWLSDGDCTVNIAEKGKGPIDSTFSGNRFRPGTVANCAIVAKDTSAPAMSGNVWDGTTDPVQLRRRPT